MEPSNLKIVCYTGGTCGDLISALIDSKDIKFQYKTVHHSILRQRLKKPHTFADDVEKDQYLHAMSTQYLSVPSHDLDYHIRCNHQFISITVQDFDTAVWAATRFRNCHRPHVWQEMQNKCGAKSINDYAQLLIDYSNMVANHTKNIVQLEDIRNGQAIVTLEKLLGIQVSKKTNNVYQNWMDLQNNTFII